MFGHRALLHNSVGGRRDSPPSALNREGNDHRNIYLIYEQNSLTFGQIDTRKVQRPVITVTRFLIRFFGVSQNEPPILTVANSNRFSALSTFQPLLLVYGYCDGQPSCPS